MLDIRERAWITYYQSIDPAFGYNQQEGGSLGRHPSAAARRKMSLAKKGRHHSEGHIRHQADAQIGRHLSEETRRKISETHKTSLKCRVQIHALSQSNRGRYLSVGHRKKLAEAQRPPVADGTRAKLSFIAKLRGRTKCGQWV
jgi:hypothetical protein